MTYIIGKSFRFDAAHRLAHLPSTHKCHEEHGHTYTVTISLITRRRDLQPEGWVFDYGRLKPFKDYIDKTLDHKNLNKVFEGTSVLTTAEHLAEYLFTMAVEMFDTILPIGVNVYSVRVQETPDTFAEFRVET